MCSPSVYQGSRYPTSDDEHCALQIMKILSILAGEHTLSLEKYSLHGKGMLSLLRTGQRKPCLGPKEQLGEILSHDRQSIHALTQQS